MVGDGGLGVGAASGESVGGAQVQPELGISFRAPVQNRITLVISFAILTPHNMGLLVALRVGAL